MDMRRFNHSPNPADYDPAPAMTPAQAEAWLDVAQVIESDEMDEDFDREQATNKATRQALARFSEPRAKDSTEIS